MKYYKLISALVALLVIVGAILTVLHYPYGRMIIYLSLGLGFFYQTFVIKELTQKLKAQKV